MLAAASILISCNMQEQRKPEEWAIVLHAGAGGSKAMSAEDEASYCIFLNEALEQGKTILASGGSALDAVEATVIYLEDCPLFNAGKGAVMTWTPQ